MSDINEKISALYDGELDQAEIDNLLEVVDSDKISQERLSFFSLITHLVSEESHDVQWIPLNEVLDMNPESSMQRMVNKTYGLAR